ncbi:hypothetical protein, partial [Staphylococcus aureus]|uniref:hypothetical protein n=1 Tax=Staphylococcus aureus TaxID=1280 RepID=UPI001C92F720
MNRRKGALNGVEKLGEGKRNGRKRIKKGDELKEKEKDGLKTEVNNGEGVFDGNKVEHTGTELNGAMR